MLTVVEPPRVEPSTVFDDLKLQPEDIDSDESLPSPPGFQDDPPAVSADEDEQVVTHFDFDAQSNGMPNAGVGTSRSASSYRPRGRRRSATLEFAKIALGGLAGLVIAQAVLWWLPGTWRRDPLGLAPKLPRSVAFLLKAIGPLCLRRGVGVFVVKSPVVYLVNPKAENLSFVGSPSFQTGDSRGVLGFSFFLISYS